MKRYFLVAIAVFSCLAASAIKKQIDKTIIIGPCQITLVGTLTVNVGVSGISGSFTGKITFGSGCEGTIPGTISFIYIKQNDGSINITEIQGGGLSINSAEVDSIEEALQNEVTEE